MSHDPFAHAIADIARNLPAGHIDAWASVLSTAATPVPAVEAALIDARPGYAVAALREHARFWYWPAGNRPAAGQSRAALHAKIIVADAHTALVSSANLTDRALSHNLEVGVVLRDPHTVERLVQHFAALMRPPANQLQRVP